MTGRKSIEPVIAEIGEAFRKIGYPGDEYLQGSFDGCEPFEEVEPFKGQKHWQRIDPEFLDHHGEALSFFSEAGFRYFLPAYLIADLRGELRATDPVFHLTYGFKDLSVDVPTSLGSFEKRIGKTAYVNPLRYGAITFFDYARYRLSVFSREESRAIVCYLEWKRDSEPDTYQNKQIEAALEMFWKDRAESAPTLASLSEQMRREAEFTSALQSDLDLQPASGDFPEGG